MGLAYGLLARRGGDEHGQLHLNGIGVLELVEQQSSVAAVQPRSHRLAVHRVAQQGAGADQEIVELELARLAALPGGREREAAQLAAQSLDARVRDRAPQVAQAIPGRAQVAAHLRGVRRPALLLAPAHRRGSAAAWSGRPDRGPRPGRPRR